MEPDTPRITDGVHIAIFDLDGTLYQGDGFVPRYLEELHQRGSTSSGTLRGELDAILAGSHPLELGDFYAPGDDVILRAPDFTVEAAFRWDGTPVDHERVGTPIRYGDDVVYAGDAWQVVRALACHFQVASGLQDEAFAAVRHAINEATSDLLDTTDLAPVLAEVPRFPVRYVMTNTPEHLGRQLVHTLGLPAHFDGIHFGANKPAGLESWLAELTRIHDVTADAVLCIGDNYFNDILPAVRAGCRSIWVDPFGRAPHRGPEVRVSGLADVAPLLRA